MHSTSAMLRVVKVGGRPQSDPALIGALVEAWRAAPGALVLVHGGGDEVSALQRAFGATPQFVGGRRVTTAADVERLRMALSGSANKRLVSQLVRAGLPAVGISGEDAGVVRAEPLDAATYGHVGRPAAVDGALVRHLLAGGYLPVISPVSADATDAFGAEGTGALNVNGDDAAAAIAIALGAVELLLVADVPGVLEHGVPIATLAPESARRLVAAGIATGGMGAKLEAAVAALVRGVERVRIGDVASIAAPDRGTVLTRQPTRARSLT